jgi:hypothetical protein
MRIPSRPSGQRTLPATLKVYAFPGAAHTATQQSQDGTECYNWAVQKTGNDPFHSANQAAQQQQLHSTAKGAAVLFA